MSRWIRTAALIPALLVTGAALFAQQPIHPNTDRGFKPETVFQVGDIDNINLFNGQLNLTIPIGPTLPMGGGRSYSLTLTYSSRVWDYRSEPNCNADPEDPQAGTYVVQAFPAMHSNAGLGWLLSLGRLVKEDDPSYHYYFNPEVPQSELPLSLYEGPDGSRHFFYAKLHDGNSEYSANSSSDPIISVGYSRDGSFIRRKNYASGLVDVDTPDGLTRRFSPAGELTRISDPFENFITVTNVHQIQADPASPIERIEIVDQYARTTTIYFRSNASDFKNYTRLVDRVVFPAFDSSLGATYQFNYENVEFARGYTPSEHACTAPLNVPTLHSVDLPSASDAAYYEFAYNENGGSDSWHQGTMSSALFPTGGSVSWEYQNYLLPSEGCTEAKWFDVQPGVKSRTLKDEGGVVIGTWTYDQTMGPMFPAPVNESEWKCSAATRQWDTGQPPNESLKELYPWIMRIITAPGQEHGAPGSTGTKTEHFFSTWKDRDPHPNGAQAWEYGLPFARISDTPAAPPYLATKQYTSTTGLLVTSSFVEYERDASPTSQDFDGNRRVKQERTVFELDDQHYVWKAHSNYDGFGHYRTTTSGGTLSNDLITSYTAFNEDPSGGQTDSEGDVFGQFAFEVIDRWLPSLFTETMVESSGSLGVDVNRALFCFDRTTGFVAGRRTLTQTTKSGITVTTSTSDTLVRYQHDGEGNVTTERYFGGDKNPIASSGCDEPGTSAAYGLEHIYSRGALETSKYTGLSFFTVDNTLDYNTGLVSRTRDTAGVEATLGYDVRGRLVSASAPGSGVTSYIYKTSPASGGPRVEVTTQSSIDSSILASEKYLYDGLGRLRQSKTLAPTTANPNGEWVTRAFEYNPLGAKTRIYEPIAESQGGQSSAYTSYSGFDASGRPASITTPDGTSTTFDYYYGRRQIDRTVGVQGPSGSTNSTTTEIYDNHGRLAQVIEQAGLYGAPVTTEYNYDAGGRLTKVCASKNGSSCGQERRFIFDGAGLLREERHPESGSTFYSLYDARGHVGAKSKPDAFLFDHQYTYDGAERPTLIKARNPYYTGQFRDLKNFSYGSTNTGDNLAKGKLASAARHTYLPFLGEMLVTEEYGYMDLAGRRTERLTIIENVSAFDLLQMLRQTRTYDELGNVEDEYYPECEWEACGTSPNKFIGTRNHYTLGRLTNIDSYSWQILSVVDSVKYHVNGMPAEILHGNGMKETITLDPSGMARPGRYTFETYGTCAAPLILAQPQGSTVPLGGSVTLAVSAQPQEGQLRYQWMTTTGPIPYANNPTYTTPALTQDASYWVHVRSWCGESTSSGAEIGLGAAQSASAQIHVAACSGPPTISTQPAGTTIPNGQSTTLTVTAGGTGPFIYQWYEGPIGEVTTAVGNGASTLSLTSMTTTRTYWVRVSNDCGSVDSNAATVTVLACSVAPSIAAQPQGATIFYSQSRTLSVTASGTGPFTYQWFVGPAGATTTPVGTNSASYTTPALTSTTQHWVRAANACGATSSQTATTTVLACSGPPSITTQPANQSIASGQTATLSVTAGGTGPFAYQWYQGTSGTTTNPVGTNSSSYTTASLASTTQYWVRISNACDATNSQTATITVSSYATPARRQVVASVTLSNNKIGCSLATTQQGSLLLVFLATKLNVAVAPPAGWQLIAEVAGTPRLRVYSIENANVMSGYHQFGFSGYSAATLTFVEYTGIATSGALDRSATATGSGTTASSGTTPATTQPNELIVTFLGAGNSSFGTATNGFGEVRELISLTVVHDRIVTSTGAYGHTCALSSSQAWRGLVLSFRAKPL